MNKTAGTIYGYLRVSTSEQNEDRQRMAMYDFGIPDKNLFLDRQSGRDFARPGYQRLIKMLKPGDTLVIKSIDRLGRNYEEILEQWRILTREKKISITVLDMPLLNTEQGRDLTGTLIADIVLQLLSYVAQTERELIRQRQAEGIAAAKARGVHMGRAPMKIPDAFRPVYDRWKNGEVSGRAAARMLGVAQHTFSKWAAAQGRFEQKIAPFRAALPDCCAPGSLYLCSPGPCAL